VLPGPQQRHKNYIVSGEANAVVWCAGHILTQFLPEDYDKRYKRWSEDDLPIVPEHWRVKLDEKKKELYDTIARFAKDATLIVHAGDPDREGQLLVDEVLERIGVKVPIKRVLISDMNGAGVRRAIKKMSDNADHTGLRDAALGRGRADWLYGLNLTRLYTVKGRATGYDGVLSVGRVQTPVLGLVVRRDREIDAFESTPFYQLTADLKAESGTFRATWSPGDEHSEHRDAEGRILKRELVESIAQAIKDPPGSIVSVDKAEKRQAPPLPFSLPELQKAANLSLIHISEPTRPY